MGQVLPSPIAIRLALGNDITTSTDKFTLPSPLPNRSVWTINEGSVTANSTCFIQDEKKDDQGVFQAVHVIRRSDAMPMNQSTDRISAVNLPLTPKFEAAHVIHRLDTTPMNQSTDRISAVNTMPMNQSTDRISPVNLPLTPNRLENRKRPINGILIDPERRVVKISTPLSTSDTKIPEMLTASHTSHRADTSSTPSKELNRRISTSPPKKKKNALTFRLFHHRSVSQPAVE